MTTVVRLPTRGRWAWDARGDRRAVRVSPHVSENVVNLSVWRDDVCVGTVRLLPAEVTALVTGLTEGLADLAERPVTAAAPAPDLEARLARLEQRLDERLAERLAGPAWRTTAARVLRSLKDAVPPIGRRPSGA